MRQPVSHLLPLFALLVLLGCAAPKAGDDDTAGAPTLVEVTPAGDPLIEMERVAEAVEWLWRGQAKNLFRLDDAGLHPLPAPS